MTPRAVKGRLRAARRRWRSVRRGAQVRARDVLVRTGVIDRGRPRLYWYQDVANFGDVISPVVVGWMLSAEPTSVSATFRGKLLAVGSVLSWALQPGDRVWGAGLLRDEPFDPPADVEFLAVRGPLSRDRIRADVPEVYGDPAALVTRSYVPRPTTRCAVTVVPHFVDTRRVDVHDPQVRVIDVRRPWRAVVDEIAASDVVISSSLHGVIIAEAYGVPAVWTTISDRVTGGTFKFHDYLLSSGRDRIDPAPWSLGLSALVERTLPPAQLDLEPLIAAGRRLRT